MTYLERTPSALSIAHKRTKQQGNVYNLMTFRVITFVGCPILLALLAKGWGILTFFSEEPQANFT